MPPNGGLTGHPRTPPGEQGLAGCLVPYSSKWATCRHLIGSAEPKQNQQTLSHDTPNRSPIPTPLPRLHPSLSLHVRRPPASSPPPVPLPPHRCFLKPPARVTFGRADLGAAGAGKGRRDRSPQGRRGRAAWATSTGHRARGGSAREMGRGRRQWGCGGRVAARTGSAGELRGDGGGRE
jgi:hypothetical protein